MNRPLSDDDWFTSVVGCQPHRLGPYPAEITAERLNGVPEARFTRTAVDQIARDIIRHANPRHPTLRLNGDVAEIRAPLASPERGQLLARVEPDTNDWYRLGREPWPWTEHTDDDHPRLHALLRDMAHHGYPPAGSQEWTVAFDDHGWRMVVLAIFPTPADESLHSDLWLTLYDSALASYEVTAPDASSAELAARRFFAADRVAADPHSSTQLLAMPSTRIPGPSES
ncbi:hypothetical protein ACTWP5_18820 [Streptomyces sp. 4N509B]|uniref:hypothetical protein n=1 Tax=Streptomyces sp. 4N509B TaxID=3457413 RepID=UPI003FD29D6A